MMKNLKSQHKKNQYGVTLIEMMVALIIGLIVSLAIYGVITSSEGRKRTTTSVNDIGQSGAYATYQLDKTLRSAGSGYGALSTATYTYGCPLRAAVNGTQILPSLTPFPAPFSAVPQTLPLTPVVIISGGAGAGGDVIITMAGSGGLSESGTKFQNAPTATQLSLESVSAFRASDTGGTSDIVLLANQPSPNQANCLISQVSPSFTIKYNQVPPILADTSTLPLAANVNPNYYQDSVNGTAIASFSTSAIVLNLGQSPTFSMFAVGASSNSGATASAGTNTLFKYDLLNITDNTAANASANPSVFSDGVYVMRAMYGVDNDGNPNTTTINWVQPNGVYAANFLLDGSIASNTLLQTIVAVKVALILQSSLPEKVPAGQPGIASPGLAYAGSTASFTLFSDTATPITQIVAPTNLRYRVFETTIPIRNRLL